MKFLKVSTLSPDPVMQRPTQLREAPRNPVLNPFVPALSRQQQAADYSPLVMGLDGRLKRKYVEVPEFMDPPVHRAKSRLLWSVAAVQELSALVSDASRSCALESRDKGLAYEVLTISDRYIRIALSIERSRSSADPAFAEFLTEMKSDIARKLKVWASHEVESISRRHDLVELGQWIYHYVGGIKEADIFKIKKMKKDTPGTSAMRKDVSSIQGKTIPPTFPRSNTDFPKPSPPSQTTSQTCLPQTYDLLENKRKKIDFRAPLGSSPLC